ncbi:Uma2 family endonuclease [Candidatus Amarolinea aalborgensis]|jgi:Uma2 family endonuclease|uniref:Uma2 family endonuclease n=1 Tax=Candidatus Amarolinea aalborgensis TaxID=2249329 RepID=UPI003BF9BDBA
MTIMQREPPTKAADQIFYPESDGKPMAETDLHREIMIWIIHLLQRFLAGQRVYVSGNLLIYYEQGNPRKSVAPDCFVVWGVESRYRPNYKLWEEGQAPQVVFEISSKTTQRDDLGGKMRLYAQLGVEEYYLYDPTGDYLEPPLAAFQLAGGGFIPMQPVNEEVRVGDLAFLLGEGEPPEFISPRLGLRLALDEQRRLQFYNVATGQRLLSDDEARQLAEAEVQALRAELARLRGELA